MGNLPSRLEGCLSVKPRHVAEIRLSRPVVGERMADPRALQARLTGRSEPDSVWETFRTDSGRALVWDHHPVPLKSFKLPEAGPNAPLLKRVVRHPYGMEPPAPVRSQVFDASRPDRTVTRDEPVQMVFRASRDARALPAPAPMDHTPEARPLPFARARLRCGPLARAGEEAG